MGTLLNGNVHAFQYFGGVTVTVLTDKMKTVVLERIDEQTHRLHVNHTILVLQRTFCKNELAPGHNESLSFVQIGRHYEVGDSGLVLHGQEDEAHRRTGTLPRNHATHSSDVVTICGISQFICRQNLLPSQIASPVGHGVFPDCETGASIVGYPASALRLLLHMRSSVDSPDSAHNPDGCRSYLRRSSSDQKYRMLLTPIIARSLAKSVGSTAPFWLEREVTGERIRDKIAASKRKGMWMGRVVPLAYDLEDRHLVVNPEEATGGQGYLSSVSR